MPTPRSSCRRSCSGVASGDRHLAHHRQGLQVGHQPDEIRLAVHADDVDAVQTGHADIEADRVALGQGVGAIVHAGGDRLRSGRRRRRTSARSRPRPGSSNQAAVQPGGCAKHLADQLRVVAGSGRCSDLHGAPHPGARSRRRGLLGGRAGRQPEAHAALQAARGQRLDHVRLLRGDQARTAPIVDGQPENRLAGGRRSSSCRPAPAISASTLLGIEARPQVSSCRPAAPLTVSDSCRNAGTAQPANRCWPTRGGSRCWPAACGLPVRRTSTWPSARTVAPRRSSAFCESTDTSAG